MKFTGKVVCSKMQQIVTVFSVCLILACNVSLAEAGQLFWSSTDTNKIQSINTNGSGLTDVVSNVNNFAGGFFVEPVTSKMYWTYNPGGSDDLNNIAGVREADLNGANQRTILYGSPLNYHNYQRIAVNPSNSRLYVMYYRDDTWNSHVAYVTIPASGYKTSSDLLHDNTNLAPYKMWHDPNEIAFNPNNNGLIYASVEGDYNNGVFGLVGTASSEITSLQTIIDSNNASDTIWGINGLVVDSTQDKIYSAMSMGYDGIGTIVQSNFDGTNQQNVLTLPAGEIFMDLAFDQYAQKFYWIAKADDTYFIRSTNADGSGPVTDIYSTSDKIDNLAFVPEPGSLALLAVSATLFIKRR